MNEALKKKWGNTLPGKGDWIFDEQGVPEKATIFTQYQPYKSPIPLTPEVMERIEKPNAAWWYDGSNEDGIKRCSFIRKADLMKITLVHLSADASFLHFCGKEFCRNPHLHHFQQLFRGLTGKELIINWEL